MTTCEMSRTAPLGAATNGSAGWLARTVETALLWRDRARSRRMLATLDDHMMRDVGLDRAAVGSEIEKPFWRP